MKVRAGRWRRVRVDIPLLGRTVEGAWGAFEVKTFRLPQDAALPAIEINFLEIDPQLTSIKGANDGRI